MVYNNQEVSAVACDFVQNKECEYFPCHAGMDPEKFSCLFCYCPLYTLGSRCGGNFSYTQKGIKNCTNCTLPHSPKGYEYILSKFDELSALAKKNSDENV